MRISSSVRRTAFTLGSELLVRNPRSIHFAGYIHESGLGSRDSRFAAVSGICVGASQTVFRSSALPKTFRAYWSPGGPELAAHLMNRSSSSQASAVMEHELPSHVSLLRTLFLEPLLSGSHLFGVLLLPETDRGLHNSAVSDCGEGTMFHYTIPFGMHLRLSTNALGSGSSL